MNTSRKSSVFDTPIAFINGVPLYEKRTAETSVIGDTDKGGMMSEGEALYHDLLIEEEEEEE